MIRSSLALGALFALSSVPASAVDLHYHDGVPCLNIGGFHFEPQVHLNTAIGTSSADNIGDIAVGAHDPIDEGFNLQGLELGGSMRSDYGLEGFFTYNFFLDGEDHVNWELEEIFAKYTNLPLDSEIRVGRFLNRFGFHNATHLHSWVNIDQNLAHSRFLGEEGLSTEGADLTVMLPTRNTTALTFSYGEAPAHAHHDHGHGDEEGHDDHDDDGDEHGEEGHLDAEEAVFSGDFFSAAIRKDIPYNDFHTFRASASGAWGENDTGGDQALYGIGLEYEWRENGLEAGGRAIRWRNEVFFRDFELFSHSDEDEHHDDHDDHDDDHGDEHHDEDEHEEGEHHAEDDHHDDEDEHHDDEDEHHDEDEEHHHDEKEKDEHHDEIEGGSFDEIGLASSLVYTHNELVDLGLRVGYVTGIDELDLESRWRISPSVTLTPESALDTKIRLQYNYDDLEHSGEEHSVWLGLEFSWGGGEVR